MCNDNEVTEQLCIQFVGYGIYPDFQHVAIYYYTHLALLIMAHTRLFPTKEFEKRIITSES